MRINKIEGINTHKTFLKTHNSQMQKMKMPSEKINNFSLKFFNPQKTTGLSILTFKGNDKNFEKNLKTFETTLENDKKFPKDKIKEIIENTNEANLPLAYKLIKDKNIPKEDIRGILFLTDENNIQAKEEIYNYINEIEDFPKEKAQKLIRYTNEQNMPIAKIICEDKNFPTEEIGSILRFTNEKTLPFVQKMCKSENILKEDIREIMRNTSEKNIEAKDGMFDFINGIENFSPKETKEILQKTDKDATSLAYLMYLNNFSKEEIMNLLKRTMQ